MEIIKIVENHNLEQLLYEIKSELLLDLYSVDGYVNTEDDQINFYFNNDLTENEIELLDTIINNHVPNSSWDEEHYYRINNSLDDPTSIDYDIIGLHKNRTIVFGELINVKYYQDYDGFTYSGLVIEESRVFIRNSDGVATRRDMNIKWYLNNGDIGLEKNTIKYYSLVEGIDEGVTRRTNIIDNAKVACLLNLGRDYSFDLLTSVKAQIGLFIDGYMTPLTAAIQASTKPYLNQTIKDAVIESLRIS
jgi:hypothetical protein